MLSYNNQRPAYIARYFAKSIYFVCLACYKVMHVNKVAASEALSFTTMSVHTISMNNIGRERNTFLHHHAPYSSRFHSAAKK